MNDRIVRLIHFPNNAVKAFTVRDDNGDFNIYINESLDNEQRIKSYLHEIGHIDNGDFDSPKDIQRIESIRH